MIEKVLIKTKIDNLVCSKLDFLVAGAQIFLTIQLINTNLNKPTKSIMIRKT